jgi:hypothetical protein
VMHLSMLTPREGGSGNMWGFDIFTWKIFKCHSLGKMLHGKFPDPREILL